MKIKKLPVLLVFLFLCSGITAQARDTFLQSLQDDILGIFEKNSEDVSATINAEVLEVEYLSRKFMMHTQFKGGGWSEGTREVIGPSNRGITIRVVLQDSLVQGTWMRPKDARGATIAVERSLPYWKELIWVMPLEGRNMNAWIYLSYGERVRGTTLDQLKELFDSIK